MTRVGRGIETLNYSTYVVTLGGIGGQPKDAGVSLQKWYLEPRVGAAYRLNENTVFRAGYGQTRNPLPWSRPMRGSYPFDINNNATATGTYDYVTTLAAGIPAVNLPDTSKGTVVLPRGVYIRSPNTGTEAFPGSGSGVDRGRVQQWNVSFERRLPKDIAVEVAYVGTATDGGYADLNYNVGVPGGGGTAAKYYASAGTTAINDWASRTKSRYKGLQIAPQPAVQERPDAQGRLHLEPGQEHGNDEDGWMGLTWNYPPMYDDNFAIAGFDRTHMFSLGWVYELPFLKNRNDALGTILGGWQLNGVAAWFTGTPYCIGGTNNAMACQGCGSILINYSGDPKAIGEAGNIPAAGTTDFSSYTYFDKTQFSQPSGLDVAGFGNTNRATSSAARRSGTSTCRSSRRSRSGRFRPEFRLDISNLFNTRNWGAPNTIVHVAELPHVLGGERRHDGNARLPQDAVGLPLPVLALPGALPARAAGAPD